MFDKVLRTLQEAAKNNLELWLTSVMSGNPGDDGFYVRDPATPSESKTVRYFGPFKIEAAAQYMVDSLANKRNYHGVNQYTDGYMRLAIMDPQEYESPKTRKLIVKHPRTAPWPEIFRNATIDDHERFVADYQRRYRGHI